MPLGWGGLLLLRRLLDLLLSVKDEFFLEVRQPVPATKNWYRASKTGYALSTCIEVELKIGDSKKHRGFEELAKLRLAEFDSKKWLRLTK